MRSLVRRLITTAAACAAVIASACTDEPPSAPSAPVAAPSLSYRSEAEKQRLEAERDARKARLETLKRQSRAQYEVARKVWKLREKQLERGLLVQLVECEPSEFDYDVQIIGPDGGHLDAGGHRLEIPKNALTESVVIEAVAPLSPGREIRFEPHGLTFRRSPELTMSFKDCFLPARFRGQVAYVADDYRVLELPRTAAAQWTTETLRAWIDHFSGYVIAHTRVRGAE